LRSAELKNRTGIGPHPQAHKSRDFSRIKQLCQEV
jgi:hypothetical protein